MGVLNVTEDSFSDGGLYLHTPAAAAHAHTLLEQGADIIDIGAESTRPGAKRVSESEEINRITRTLEAIREDAHAHHVQLSIDTTRSSVAQAALDEGADIINDVSGGTLDPHLPQLVARTGKPYIVQHWRGWLDGRDSSKYEHGVVADTVAELHRQIISVLNSGVKPEQIIADPGLGFSKPGPELNYPLIEHLEELQQLGFPVLIGASRKRFVKKTLLDEQLRRLAPTDNLEPQEVSQEVSNDRLDVATAMISVLAAQKGAWAVRVHNVQASRDALAVWETARHFERNTAPARVDLTSVDLTSVGQLSSADQPAATSEQATTEEE